MLDNDLVADIMRAFVEEDDSELAATLFLSVPLEQRKVYLATIVCSLRDKVEDWLVLAKEIMAMEEVFDISHPPSDLINRLSVLAEDIMAGNIAAC